MKSEKCASSQYPLCRDDLLPPSQTAAGLLQGPAYPFEHGLNDMVQIFPMHHLDMQGHPRRD